MLFLQIYFNLFLFVPVQIKVLQYLENIALFRCYLQRYEASFSRSGYLQPVSVWSPPWCQGITKTFLFSFPLGSVSKLTAVWLQIWQA